MFVVLVYEWCCVIVCVAVCVGVCVLLLFVLLEHVFVLCWCLSVQHKRVLCRLILVCVGVLV